MKFNIKLFMFLLLAQACMMNASTEEGAVAIKAAEAKTTAKHEAVKSHLIDHFLGKMREVGRSKNPDSVILNESESFEFTGVSLEEILNRTSLQEEESVEFVQILLEAHRQLAALLNNDRSVDRTRLQVGFLPSDQRSGNGDEPVSLVPLFLDVD